MGSHNQKDRPTQEKILWTAFGIAIAAIVLALLFLLPSELAIRVSPSPTIATSSPEETSTDTFTPPSTSTIKPSATFTSTFICTATLAPTETFTATSLPPSDGASVFSPRPIAKMPIPKVGSAGTNLPPGFTVGPWRDDSCDMNGGRFVVRLLGVDISEGADPSKSALGQFADLQLNETREYNFTFLQRGEIIAKRTAKNTKPTIMFDGSIVVKRGSYVHVLLTFNWEEGEARWEDDLLYPRGRASHCP